MERLTSFFSLDQITNECDTSKFEFIECPNKLLIHNHIENSEQLGDKIHMFKNMKEYYESMDVDIYTVVPLTFIVYSINENNFEQFLEYFNDLEIAKHHSCGSFKN